MPTGFHDVQFPNDISVGAMGGPSYDTTIATSASGYEQRNLNWDQARMRWEVGHVIVNEAKLNLLLSFWRARKGMAYGFRFKDWSDYYVGLSFVSDVLTYTSFGQFGTGDGATKVFQLSKTYTDSVNPEVRKITRPVSGTVRIYLAGVQQGSGFAVDYTTGLVTFTTAPGTGVAIQWAGQFDIPARFDTDGMKFTLEAVKRGEWLSVPIIELRE